MKREKFIKTLIYAVFAGFVFCLGAQTARAQTTAFTYQGRLTDGSNSAPTGTYDLRFTLDSGDFLINCNGATSITNNICQDVSVVNGIFTVRLDFGAAAFSGAAQTLGIGVRRGDEETGAFTPLAPAQPITSTPYAIQSLKATTAATATNAAQLGGLAASNYLRFDGDGSQLRNLNASNIRTGTLDDEQLSANVVLRNEANTFRGDQTFDRNIIQTGGKTDLNALDGFVARGIVNNGAIPATGAGVRMMFYPRKAAFRAGQVDADQWNDANVGLYSSAFGFNARATSQTAFAAGDGTLASGRDAVAFGYRTTASGSYSIALGYQTTASGAYSTTLGFGPTASGTWSTAFGYVTTASGQASTAFGGGTTASGFFSTAFGNNTTASGSYSTAFGSLASTNGKEGAFVYGDGSSNSVINAVADNEFAVRAAGGFRFRTNENLTTGCNLPANSGSFSCTSSRTLKENFLDLKSGTILEKLRRVPVLEWSYKNEPNSVRHIGAFAEDFYREFKLGTDDKSIGLLDIAGVNTAAIKELDDEIKMLRTENAALKSKLENQQTQFDALKKLICADNQTADVCRQP